MFRFLQEIHSQIPVQSFEDQQFSFELDPGFPDRRMTCPDRTPSECSPSCTFDPASSLGRKTACTSFDPDFQNYFFLVLLPGPFVLCLLCFCLFLLVCFFNQHKNHKKINNLELGFNLVNHFNLFSSILKSVDIRFI